MRPRSLGFCFIVIVTIAILSTAAVTDPKIRAYGDSIAKALSSKQIISFMRLIPKDLVLYGGENYGAIEKEFSQLIGNVIHADITDITLIDHSLHRITIMLELKANQRIPLHFDIFNKAGQFRIADIYDSSELKRKESLKILKSYPAYHNEPVPGFPGFTFMKQSDPDLTRLRATYDLEKVAGTGPEIDQIIRLMQWVHKLVPHAGDSQNPAPQNSFNIIDVCQKEKRGVNCRMLATVLNEVYLAMGFKSRVITCLPADIKDTDCHVTNLVFSTMLDKWVYMDPSFEAYFTDSKGIILNHAEIRKAIIDGTPISVNDGLNHNGSPYGGGKSAYIRYMTKNIVRFNSTLRSEFGIEDKSPLYMELFPKGYLLCEEAERKAVGDHFQCISNEEIFWAAPEITKESRPGK